MTYTGYAQGGQDDNDPVLQPKCDLPSALVVMHFQVSTND